MTVFIQKGDKPFTVRQAEKRGRALLDLEMKPHEREAASAQDKEGFAEWAAKWEADNRQNVLNNIFNTRLDWYRKALTRLSRYRLTEGREGLTQEEVSDDVSFEVTLVTHTHTDQESYDQAVAAGHEILQSYIPPFEPLTVEQNVYDEEGNVTGTETVPHPQVAKDEAERVSAQAVIDNTPQEVKDFDA